MGLELSGGSCIVEHDQIVVLSSLATRIESRRSRSEQLTINFVGFHVHQRPKPFHPNVVGKVAELAEIKMLARIEDNADDHSAAVRVV